MNLKPVLSGLAELSPAAAADLDAGKFADLAWEVLDILPNPVLVKNHKLEYVWVNQAFEGLFSVTRSELKGQLDRDLFPERQVSQCNSGDLRVLESGEIDESSESVYEKGGDQRETITRKSRLTLNDNVYLVGVMHDITDLTHANQLLEVSRGKLEKQAVTLQEMANTDELTGCRNRRYLMSCADGWVQSCQSTLSLMLFDIDRFKSVNDQHGHEVGDLVLKHFVAVLNHERPNDTELIRLGGEEFALIAFETALSEAHALANQMRAAIERADIIAQGKRIKTTTSVGIAYSSVQKPATINELLYDADMCLYKAKANGRNRVVVASA